MREIEVAKLTAVIVEYIAGLEGESPNKIAALRAAAEIFQQSATANAVNAVVRRAMIQPVRPR